MQPGTRLGPYEVIAPIGAGGMGEVYRARDTRLGRDVAIKVLPAEYAADADRLRRLEQEARAVAALDHPNILALYDVGTHVGSPYIVTQLLEGESLRERLQAGPLTPRKAIEVGAEIAQGLAAAHEKGIIHRDLKPGNVFITKDGQVKILDFGLAKLAPLRTPEEKARATTVMDATDAGTVLGTVAYMSPEQVLGKPLDASSDLFSLGVVVYEMLSGRRPFQKDSVPETMAAILKDEAPDLAEIGRAIPPGLARIVQHCLEKEPSSRFQSARDVSFDLESLSQATSALTAPLKTVTGTRRMVAVTLGVALLAASYVGVFLWTKHAVKAPTPSFTRITFRHGLIASARFTPDSQSIVYFARWGEGHMELFVQHLGSPNARSLGVGFRAVPIVGVVGGEVAVIRDDGTLVQFPLEGGTPRELLKDIDSADWDRSGTRFAIARNVGGRHRLEYPVGKVLCETANSISRLRISPDGTRIGFGERDESGFNICTVDLEGRKKTLSKGWHDTGNEQCWSPDGHEIWFSAGGNRLDLHAVTLTGRERLVAGLPGHAIIRDIAPDGRVVVAFGPPWRWETRGRMQGDTAERDLSWLDGTSVSALSPDGSQMIFAETSEGGGLWASAYHWRMDGSTPKRLGPGHPLDVSPDWMTALVADSSGGSQELKLIPIGPGETRALPRGPIRRFIAAAWHPDGKRIVIVGTDTGGKAHLYVQDVTGGEPRPFAAVEATHQVIFSADGRFAAARPRDREVFALYPIEGGEPHPISFLQVDDEPLVFGSDGSSLFVARDAPESGAGRLAKQVQRLDLVTGKRQPWLELVPADQAGMQNFGGVALTPDGRFYAYSYARVLRDLYVVEGLK